MYFTHDNSDRMIRNEKEEENHIRNWFLTHSINFSFPVLRSSDIFLIILFLFHFHRRRRYLCVKIYRIGAGRVYLILRSKRNVMPVERIEKITSGPVSMICVAISYRLFSHFYYFWFSWKTKFLPICFSFFSTWSNNTCHQNRKRCSTFYVKKIRIF